MYHKNYRCAIGLNHAMLIIKQIQKNKIGNHMAKNKYMGQNFDDFLKEEGILEEIELAVIKRVIAEQIVKEMKKKKISQTEMAKRLGTSRTALNRLINPKNYSVTLLTLYRAANALGKNLEIRFQ
jgi:antitoxin HicB